MEENLKRYTILESWEDLNHKKYAILKFTRRGQKYYSCKRYEVVWFDDENLDDPLCSFAGGVGWNTGTFDTLHSVQAYLIKCIVGQDDDPDIWFEKPTISTTKNALLLEGVDKILEGVYKIKEAAKAAS